MGDWEELVDPASSAPYYRNLLTNETTWEKPASFGERAAAVSAVSVASSGGGQEETLPAPWTKVLDPTSQQYYYFNTETKASQWTAPEVEEQDRPATAPASLEPKTPGSEVEEAPVTYLAHKDRLSSLDEFEELVDPSSGKPYYRNKRTNETQWDPPFKSLADRNSVNSVATTAIPQTPTSANLSADASPTVISEDEDYQEIMDPKTGHTYYRHKKTNEITWTRPYRLQSQQFTSGLGQSVSSLESSMMKAVKLNPDGTRQGGNTASGSFDQFGNKAFSQNRGLGDASWRSSGNLGAIPGTPSSECSFSGSLQPPTPFLGTPQSFGATMQGYGLAKAGSTRDLLKEQNDTVNELPKFNVTNAGSNDRRRRSTSMPDPTTSSGQLGGDSRHSRSGSAMDEKKAAEMRQRSGSLPKAIMFDIHNFRFTEFANEHFQAHKKKGVIRSKKVPTEQLMSHSKDQLRDPLLHVPECAVKDALHTFKQILSYMGDRSSSKDPQTHMLSLLQKGISRPELRDEVYCQLCKQTTKNSNLESQFRGWELMAQCCCIFPPSRSLENYLFEYLYRNSRTGGGRVSVMARHCIRALRITLASPPRSDLPSVEELEKLKKPTAFSDFSTTLDSIMKRQKALEDECPLPRVFVTLTDSVLENKGYTTEGIFRVPAESGEINVLKEKIESGQYKVDSCSAHVPAGLLKMWLRTLKTPLIPRVMYDACLKACQSSDESRALVAKLPEINRRIVEHLTSFLAIFCSSEYEIHTKMSTENLAMVFAPTLFKQEFVSGMHSGADKEQMFVHNLIATAPPMEIHERHNK